MSRRVLFLVAPVVVAVAVAAWFRGKSSSSSKAPTSEELSVIRPALAARPRARMAYDGTIYGPTDPSPTLAAALDDVAQHLKNLTGSPVVVHAGSGSRGIVLVRTNGLVQAGEAEQLAGKGPEAFLIRSADDQSLRIIANGDAGLAYGLYHYLRELGFRWFLPGDRWAIVPSVATTAIRVDRVVTPAFRQRSFFGTGGFGPRYPLDDKQEAAARWAAWQLRNGFGGEIAVGGHTGEAFAVAHRDILQAHPEYLALVGGKRVPWAKGARYCVSNPELRALFVADRMAAFEQALTKYPSAPTSFAVSVEPADGEGHCECDRCRRIGKGTESDQTFFLANAVAKAVRERHPGKYASLLAYSQHAAPPSIPIEPNVYVVVVPEAFQRTGLGSDALIREWKKKVVRLGLYTYWSIPDWAYDLPSFDYRYTPASRIRAWHRAGIESLGFETSYGAGATGIGLYLAGQLMWNPESDPEVLLDEFYRLAFGKAADSMKRLLERWASNFIATDYELGAAYRDLAEARARTAGDPAATARVRDYQIYLHYVRLWIESRRAPKDVPRLRNLVTWLYRAHDAGMVGTYRMRTLLLDRLSKDASVSADFALGNPAAPGWADAKVPIGDRELSGLMADGGRRYPPPAVDVKVYGGKLVQLRGPLPDVPDESLPLHFVHPTDFEIQVAPGQHLEVEVTIGWHRRIPFEGVTIRAEDGTIVYEERLPANGVARPIKLQVPPGRYTCRVEDQKATFTVTAPRGVALTSRALTSTSVSPRVYFWVPAGLRKLAMYVPSVYPIELRDADGHAVAAAGSGMVTADVPPGQDGRAWSLRLYKSSESIRMINLPQAFARSPAALLVPEDAVEPGGVEQRSPESAGTVRRSP